MRVSGIGAYLGALGPVVVCAGAVACTEPLTPGDVAGSYVLSRVASDSVPAIVAADSFRTIRVLADTLRLGPAGAGSEAVREVVAQSGSATADTVFLTTGLTYRIRQSALSIEVLVTYVCPINADCAPGPHLWGRLIPDGIEMDGGLGRLLPLIYRRLPAS